MKTMAPALGAPTGTRGRLARLLLEEGPNTATVLASRLGLTTAGVRRHLDVMVEEGVLLASEPRPTPWLARGRGRPAKLYTLSDQGHERADQAYDQLAAQALHFLADSGAVEAFAQRWAEDLKERYAGQVAGPAAATALADALTRDGYAATTHEVPSGTQICQHHCPVSHVAAQFPQLCEAETEAIGQLLGQHVQRLATIAHGDGVCTTHVPRQVPTTGKARKKGSA